MSVGKVRLLTGLSGTKSLHRF